MKNSKYVAHFIKLSKFLDYLEDGIHDDNKLYE